MGRLLGDEDRRLLSAWYDPADSVRVVPPSPTPARVVGRCGRAPEGGSCLIGSVSPLCGPEAGGERVTVAGRGFDPHRGEWSLRFGSVVVREEIASDLLLLPLPM